MNTTTMDAHGSHLPAPRPQSDGRFKELAIGVGYLLTIGTGFTVALSLALIFLVGE